MPYVTDAMREYTKKHIKHKNVKDAKFIDYFDYFENKREEYINNIANAKSKNIDKFEDEFIDAVKKFQNSYDNLFDVISKNGFTASYLVQEEATHGIWDNGGDIVKTMIGDVYKRDIFKTYTEEGYLDYLGTDVDDVIDKLYDLAEAYNIDTMNDKDFISFIDNVEEYM